MNHINHILLYNLLFETDTTDNTAKDVADAVKTALEPITKDVGKIPQIAKDIEVIQKASGERKQEPTNSRSTTGADQTVAATTKPKGPGSVSNTSPANKEKPNNNDLLQTKIEDIDKKLNSLVSRNN